MPAAKIPMNKRPKCPKCGRHMLLGPKSPAGKQRWQCVVKEGGVGKYCYSTTDASRKTSRKSKTQRATQFKRTLDHKTFVVTAAQNATPVHEGFLQALLCYCKERDAELIVIPIRYKNPTSIWTASQADEEFWADSITPYLYNQRKKLNDNIVLLGDIKTRPTAVTPLEGFEGITHGESCILGHTKVQLKTVAAPQSKFPKILTTTGAITKRNYTDSKAGKLGEFHHTFGAAVVETVGKTFHLRQITACNDGSFIDLDREYFPNGMSGNAPPAAGLVLGDLHYRTVDPAVVEATFGKGGIVEATNPGAIVFHDLLDGMARNPHHVGNPFAEYAKRTVEYHNVSNEVYETVKWASEVTKGRRTLIVPSNHDAFLSRWIMSADWKADADNALFYLRTALAMLEGTEMSPAGHTTIDPFAHWVKEWGGEHVEALHMDQSVLLGGVEVNMHGDRGPNGARGSVKNLSRLGVRTTTGHGHSPAIEEGHQRVGTSSYLRLEYNKGPSSWLQSHGLLYANSKRTLINVINGKWRA